MPEIKDNGKIDYYDFLLQVHVHLIFVHAVHSTEKRNVKSKLIEKSVIYRVEKMTLLFQRKSIHYMFMLMNHARYGKYVKQHVYYLRARTY